MPNFKSDKCVDQQHPPHWEAQQSHYHTDIFYCLIGQPLQPQVGHYFYIFHLRLLISRHNCHLTPNNLSENQLITNYNLGCLATGFLVSSSNNFIQLTWSHRLLLTQLILLLLLSANEKSYPQNINQIYFSIASVPLIHTRVNVR